jgi:hypothetical protein
VLRAAVAYARSNAAGRDWQIFEAITFHGQKPADLAVQHGVKVGAIHQAKYRVQTLIKEKALELDEASDDRELPND